LQEYPLVSQTYIKTELERVARHHEVRIVAFDKAHVPYRRHLPFELLDKTVKSTPIARVVGDFAPDRIHAHYVLLAPPLARAAQAQTGMERHGVLAQRRPEVGFDLYALGYRIEAMKRLNQSLAAPVRIVDPVEPDAMPAEYKQHRWLVYTASPQHGSVGWPMAVAEAQASGVGVLMQNVRPDLADYVGPGFLFDDIEEAHRVIRGPLPEDRREAGFAHAMRSDV